MSKKFIVIIGMVILSLLVILAGCAPGGVVKAEEFYKGKTVFLGAGGRAGGGNDMMARGVVPFLNQYTGATFAVRNLEKAGDLETGNTVWDADPDGLTTGIANFLGLVLREVLDSPGIKFETSKFEYIFGVGPVPQVLVVKPDGPYQSISDLMAGKDIKLGGYDPESNTDLSNTTVADVLDLDARMITGLAGTKAIVLAITQGEIDGSALTFHNIFRFKDQVKPLFIVGTERHPSAPDLPALSELVDLSGDDLEILRLWSEVMIGAKAMLTTPGVPRDRVEFLRQAAEQAFQDPAFLKQLEDVMSFPGAAIITGEELSKSAETMAKQKDLLSRTFADMVARYFR